MFNLMKKIIERTVSEYP